MMEKKRNIELDIVKGLCIILMVMGHCNFPYSKFVYLFHMAVFFIASGYLQKDEYSEDIKGVKIYVGKRIKTLWLPYFVFNTIFVLFNNIFIYLNIYTDNSLILTNAGENIAGLSEKFTIGMTVINIVKGFFFLGGSNMGVTFWFLRALFVASMMMCLSEYALKRLLYGKSNTANKYKTKNKRKNKTQNKIPNKTPNNKSKTIIIIEFLFATVLLVIGFYITKNGIYARNIPVYFTSFFLMASGRLYKILEEKKSIQDNNNTGVNKSISDLDYKKENKIISDLNIKEKNRCKLRKSAICIVSIVVSFSILLVFNNFTTIDLSENKYNGIISMIIVSYAGWILMMFTAKLIKSLRVCKILLICGQNSLAIMILHILCFKLVSLIQVIIYNEPYYMLASFPVLNSKNGWWIIYTISGVTIPILINGIRRMLTRSKNIAFDNVK